MYYKDRLSREEIAGQIGIKQEKLQYQLQKLVNKLKHPVYLNYLTDGISLLDDIKKRNEKLEEEIKELKRENLLLKEKLFSKEGKYGEFLVPKGLDTKLEDMGLSVRLNDVLVMRDYRTVRDFEGKTGKQLRDMKGMGKKSYEELREVLKLYNIFID